MAASASPNMPGFGTSSSSSPYTTSPDDVFADINWPQDDNESLFDFGDFAVGATGEFYGNESFKHGSNIDSDLVASSTTDSRSQSTDGSSTGTPKPQAGTRFSKHTKSILRAWFHEHKDNPYPTSEEKRELASRTGLKPSQISLWLVNTRRRYRAKKQHKAALASARSEENSGSTEHLSDDQEAYLRLARPFEELNPMDRWKVLPVEHEPADASLIFETAANAPDPGFNPFVTHYRWQVGHHHSAADLESAVLSHNDSSFWGDSMASYDTGMPSMGYSGSSITDSTAYTTTLSLSHYAQAARDPTRRRRKGVPSKMSTSNLSKTSHAKPPSSSSTGKEKERLFQCTFCPPGTSTFSTKHDWTRHEKSQHLNLDSWTCCPSGPTYISPSSPSTPLCVFCDFPNPDTLHLESHNFSSCAEKDASERTFFRKDHFMQHLRLSHDCSKIQPCMGSWRSEIRDVHSRCGFCTASFTTWAARAEHLAAHFKCRADMRDWKGDLGFEPHVAALVQGAMTTATKAAGAHPKVAAPLMPPPPLPLPYGLGVGAGLDFQIPSTFDKGALLPLGGFDAGGGLPFDLDPTLDPVALLGMENIGVTDWASFGG